jgi:hypothetical protein
MYIPHLIHLLRWALIAFFPGLALNKDSPNLCHLSRWNYRHEPLHPTIILDFLSVRKKKKNDSIVFKQGTIRGEFITTTVITLISVT